MILSNDILIPKSCPLNFIEDSISKYKIREYCQKWINGDKIKLQVRSNVYSSGLSLRVYDSRGVFMDSENFSAFQSLSDGYDYANVSYTIDLDDGFYYFCICDGDTWLAQSTWNYIGKNENTFICEYSDEDNKVETIFKNSSLTATTGFSRTAPAGLNIPRFFNSNGIDTGMFCSYSVYSGSRYFVINGIPSNYTATYHNDLADDDGSINEVSSGVYKYSIGLVSGTSGYIAIYNESSVEIARTFTFELTTTFDSVYVYPYFSSGFLYTNVNTNDYVEYSSPTNWSVFSAVIYENKFLIRAEDFNGESFTHLLYDEDDNLVQTLAASTVIGYGFIADLDGNYYIKTYRDYGLTGETLLATTVLFYTDGSSISIVNNEDNSFYFRCEGGFKPNSDSQKINSTDFSDQEDEVVPLHQNPYVPFELTIGDNRGVPMWVREKMNIILSLKELRFNFLDMTKASEVKTFEAEDIEDTGSKILKVELQPSYNDFAQSNINALSSKINILSDNNEFLTL